MKRAAIGLITLMLVVAGSLTVRRLSREQSAPALVTPAVANVTTSRVVGVSAFMREVDKYRGEVVVAGAVRGLRPDGFELVDADGVCSDCAEGCGPLVLPVRWSGAAPVVGAALRVQGQVSEQDGKLVFAASALPGPRAGGAP